MRLRTVYIGIAISVIVIAGIIVTMYLMHKFQQLITLSQNLTITRTPKLKILWISDILIDKSWLIEHGMYVRAWSWKSFIKGSVVISPNGKYIAVTTQKGEIYVFNSNGSLVRKLEFGLGKVPYYGVVFSPDSKYLIVGLSSRNGELLVYDLKTWSLIFTYKASNDLLSPSNASEITILKKPWYGNVIQYVTFDNKSVMYVVISQRVIDPEKQRPIYRKVNLNLFEVYPELRSIFSNLTSYVVELWVSTYISRIIAIDTKTWKILWKWPKDDYAYILISMIDVDSYGKYLAACSWWGYYYKDPKEWHGGTIFVINASSGQLLYRWDVPPRVPIFNRTNIWNGIDLTSDGKYLAVIPSDGRVYVLDNEKSVEKGQPVVLWERTIMNPILSDVLLIPKGTGNFIIKKTYIYSGTYFAGIVKDRVILYCSVTYSTYWSPKYERKPLHQHPNQTKLFIFNLKTGELLFIDKFSGKPMYGKVRPFASSKCYLTASIGNDWVSADASMAGIYVWDVCNLKLVAKYLTVSEGYGVPLDVAMHDNKIYVLTGPINVAHSEEEPAKIVGDYRLIALELVE